MSWQTDTAPGERAYWIAEALAGEEGYEGVTVLHGRTRAEVCIIGGGYTGLWTALHLKERAPELDVVILERDLCGTGASGRNAGFVLSWWSKFPSLQKRIGTDEALRACRASADAVEAVGAFCREHSPLAHFQTGGWLWSATNAAQVDAWQGTIAAIESHGEHPFRSLDAPEAARMAGTDVVQGGVVETDAATVQPARLARDLRRAALSRGVRIFEASAMSELEEGAPARVRTRFGEVVADSVVLASNAWSAQRPELRRKLLVVATDAFASEPIPELLAGLGWKPGLGITDSRRTVESFRATHDGRLVMTKGGGGLRFRSRLDCAYDGPSKRLPVLKRQLARVFPSLGEVPVAAAWRGPVDYSVSGLPYFGRLNGNGTVFTGSGYSGNGIGPSYLGGISLAAQVLGQAETMLPGGLTSAPADSLPPEPIRYVGGELVRAATERKEGDEDRGRRTGAMTRWLSAQDPTEFVAHD